MSGWGHSGDINTPHSITDTGEHVMAYTARHTTGRSTTRRRRRSTAKTILWTVLATLVAITALAIITTPDDAGATVTSTSVDHREECPEWSTVVTVERGETPPCDLIGGDQRLDITGMTYEECDRVGGLYTDLGEKIPGSVTICRGVDY